MSAIHLPYIQTDIQPDTRHTLAAAVVPIRVFFRRAGIGNREPLSQAFFVVAGGRGIQGSDADTVESHWERLVGTGKDVAGGSAWHISKTCLLVLL